MRKVTLAVYDGPTTKGAPLHHGVFTVPIETGATELLEGIGFYIVARATQVMADEVAQARLRSDAFSVISTWTDEAKGKQKIEARRAVSAIKRWAADRAEQVRTPGFSLRLSMHDDRQGGDQPLYHAVLQLDKVDDPGNLILQGMSIYVGALAMQTLNSVLTSDGLNEEFVSHLRRSLEEDAETTEALDAFVEWLQQGRQGEDA